MIEINGIWILSVSLLIVAFLAVVLIAKFLTKPFDKINFSFLRVFPSEVIENTENYSTIYKLCLYLFGLMGFFPIFVLANADCNFGVLYLASSLLGLAGICFVFLHFFNPSHVKVHLLLFVLFGCLVIAGSFASGFGSLLLIDHYEIFGNSHRISCIIKASISFLFVVIELVLLLNPKLRNWAKLEKTESGEIVRPRKFPLAYTEWATFLVLILSELSLYATLIK